MKTLKQINKIINQARKDGVQLAKGNGYFYFYGGNSASWKETGVYVSRLNDLTPEGWIREAARLESFA